MRQVLHVLFLAVARFLHDCAEFLARLGERPVSAAEAPEFPLRTARPPEDWLRRASPTPPAHWLKTVRARAPGFLREPAVDSANRDTVLAEPFPRKPAFAVRPIPAFKGADPKSAERAADLLPPVRTPRPDVVRRPTPSRPVRIITVVEERPRRTPAPPSWTPSDAGSETPERPDPPTMKPPAPAGEPRTPLRPVRESKGFRTPAAELRQEPAAAPFDEEDAWTPLFHPAADSVSLPPTPGREAFATVDRADDRLSASAADHPDVQSERPTSESRHPGAAPAPVAGRWPTLPASDLGDDADDVRLLLRELRRQAELEHEQRGMPWSA